MKSLPHHGQLNLLLQDHRYPEWNHSSGFQIQSLFLIITCLRLCCPALPADTGHSDGCAAANRCASGDGLRPAGADTPGSGVIAALCQCHDRVTGHEFACYNQGCFSWPISVLFGWFPRPPPTACLTAAWTAWSSAQCVLCQPRVPACAQKTTVWLSWVCLLLLKASFASQMLFFLMRMKAIWNMSHMVVFCS